TLDGLIRSLEEGEGGVQGVAGGGVIVARLNQAKQALEGNGRKLTSFLSFVDEEKASLTAVQKNVGYGTVVDATRQESDLIESVMNRAAVEGFRVRTVPIQSIFKVAVVAVAAY